MFDLEKAKTFANICRATYESKPILSDYAQLLREPQLILPDDKTVPVTVLSGFLDEQLIIAYRGSVVVRSINQEADIVLNMLTCMVCNFMPILRISPNSLNSLINVQETRDIYGGEVHLGFALLINKIWSKIESLIEHSKPHKICLTGHSLGGALATLTAYRLRKHNFPINVYTFGSPRVGDSEFVSRYKDSKVLHFSIENKNDIIPHLPPDAQTSSKINISDIVNLLKNLDFLSIDDLINFDLINLRINLDYKPVGNLKFINWNDQIVEYSDSLRTERLFRLPKSILDIRESHALLDHEIQSYYQALDHCRTTETEEISMPSLQLDKIVYNIAVVGRTGAGKSSLINYLCGHFIAKTGVGSPVTKKGFHRFNIGWASLPINIYDSSGLEVGRASEWQEMLDDELKEHGTDRPVSEWFHTIFYCINAASTRIESFEFEIIESFIKNKYRVIVVLTKAELMSEDTISTFKNRIGEIVSSEIPIVEVCSVKQTTRIGITETFGIETLQKETLRGFWSAIAVRLPERCEFVLHQEVDKWCEDQKQIINATKENLNHEYKRGELMRRIENNYAQFFKNLKETRYKIIVVEVKEIVEYYEQLVTVLEYPPPEDLPMFQLEKKELIQKSWAESIYLIFENSQQIPFQIIATVFQWFLPDSRPSLVLAIDRFRKELKDEISMQTPEFSKLIEKIRNDQL